MDFEEFTKLCDALRANGLTNKDILGVILKMYEDDKIDLEGMNKMAGALGYELSDEFLQRVSK